MKKVLMACVAIAAVVSGGAAHADRVYWSVGVSTPVVGTVISNSPRVYVQPAPVYAPPPQVVYAPPPVVYSPPPVVYAPPPQVVYQPPVVVYGRGHHKHHHRKYHHRDDRYWGDGWSDDRRYRY